MADRFSSSLAKELQQIPSWHQLHDYIHWLIVYTHTQYLDNILMVEITKMEKREREERERERGNGRGKKKERLSK